MPSDLVTIETPNGTFQSFKGDLISEQLQEFGGHQRPDLAAIRSFIRPGDVILDVGANIGTFAIPFATSAGPSGRVYGFEPMDETAAVLRANIEGNALADRISLVQSLVSDVPGDFVPELLDHNVAATRFVRSEDAHGSAPTTVRIDDWADATIGADADVHLIKIDVEGMDIPVLRSSQRLIERCLPVVTVEIAVHELTARGERLNEIEDVLAPLGYHFFRNLSPRNAANDTFELGRLESLADGGPFYDLIAVHADSDRYPSDLASAETMNKWRAELQQALASRKQGTKSPLLRRIARRLRS